MIKTLPQAYTAGLTVKYSIPASNFRLLTLSAAAPVDIRFYKNGAVQSEALGMLDGFAQEDQPFDAVEITSATAQTVVVVIADGHVKYDRFSGSVSVTNLPATQPVSGAVSVSNFPATQPVSGSMANTAAENPQIYGASYASNAALVANTAVAVVAPASNVNGIIVHAASMTFYFAALSGFGGLVAKSSAPANNADGDVLFTNGSGATAQVFNTNDLKRPVKIAPGKGLYFINSASEGGGLRSVQYTLL